MAQQQAQSGLTYSLISLKDLSKGLDLRSSESNVQEMYSETLDNCDVVSSGQVSKRVGYQGFAGYLPLRVTSVSHDGSYQISMKLATGVDLTGIPSSPINVYGKFDHSESGDFSNTAVVRTYEGFSVDVRDVFTATGTTATKSAADTGATSPSLFVYSMTSTSEQDASNSAVLDDSITINSSTDTATIVYSPASTERAYTVILDKKTSAGSSYVASYSGSPIVLSGSTITGTITAATHGLSNFNIIAQIYTLSGSTYTQVIPDVFSIATNGDVTFTLTDTTNFTGQVVLSIVPVAQTAQLTVASGATSTITITGCTTNYPFWALYRLNGTAYERVIPDAVTLNAATATMTVTITNSTSSSENYKFNYDFGTINATTIRVVDTQSSAASYTGTVITNPQLTIWGISHKGRYTSASTRGGEVLHLDSYKRDLEARLVAGIGGTLYAARTFAEVATTYALPSLQVNLTARLSSSVALAPLFQPTGTSSTVRTRGIITGDNVSGTVLVSAVSYVSPGVADYSLNLVNQVGTLALGSQIATTDYLTITGMGYAAHNGTFKMLSITSQSGGVIVLRVANSSVLLPDFNETGALGAAQVYTDNLTVTTAPNYVPGDTLTASSIPVTLKLTAVSGTTLTVSGVTQSIALASGINVYGARTAYIHPLRNTAATPSVTGMVRGDMVAISGLVRQVRVNYLNPFQDMSISLAVSGGVATVSLGGAKSISGINTGTGVITCTAHGMTTNDPVLISTTGTLPTGLRSDAVYFTKVLDANTLQLLGAEGAASTITLATSGSGALTLTRPHKLSVGQRITISQTGDPLLDGVQVVTSVPSASGFTYTTTSTGSSATGVMVGRTCEWDESLTLADSLATPAGVTVEARWVPIEGPTTTSTAPKSTYTSYFNDTADNLRSAMSASTMYFLNQNDAVMKFDGTSVYQAGLWRWQPHMFAQVDTTTGSLTLDSGGGTVQAGTTGGKFVLLLGEAIQYSPGDRIVHSADSAVYTVQSISTGVSGATNDYVYVTTTITGAASGTLKKVKTYHYYARLNAIDRNNNIIASAATGADDLVVELSAAGQIKMRLVGMPAWGVYDYDRIELQLYRTVGNTPAPYYRIRSVPIAFNTTPSYIDVVDTISDVVLTQTGDLDSTMTALKGANLGTAWEQPPRAKYICAVGNRLVLANLKDYQQLDIVFRTHATSSSMLIADLDGRSLTFKKDQADTGTSSDMLNRMVFTFQNSTTYTITPASITCTSTTFTVPTASPPAVGQWVYLYHSAVSTTASLNFSGWWQVASVVAATSFTVNFPNSYSSGTTADCDRFVTAASGAIPVYLGTDGNYSALKFGNTTLSYEFHVAWRLAQAINAVQVAVDTTVTGMSGFIPWMTANAGSEYTLGQVQVRVPKYSATTLGVVVGSSALGSSVDLYINNIKQSASAAVSAQSRLFPSRVAISYDSYPEVFDGPFATLGTTTDSVADVNISDGEEITGVITFFSDSAFGTSQVENQVIIFKTNSIYVMNLTTRGVQKLETQGIGCTAPYSIAHTKNGIMFANLAGVYRLNVNLTVSYVGKYIERIWRNNVNADALSVATAHNYGVARQYKLSVPYNSDTKNSVVLVYDNTKETPAYANVDEGFGAWTRYTNHAATGWCSLGSDSYFSTTDGQIFKVRRANDATDYRDDAGPVDTMRILLRAIDCGMAGVRKACRALVSHIRMDKTSVTGTVMSAATENSMTFNTIGTINVTLGDKKVVTFKSSLPVPRFVYLNVEYTNAVKDENFVLAGVDIYAAPLNHLGLVQRTNLK